MTQLRKPVEDFQLQVIFEQMTPKQWLVLLCIYILYLFLGTFTFYYIEHAIETKNMATQLKDRISINELLVKNVSPEDEQIQNKVMNKLSGYCGRPVTNYTLDQYPADYQWTFYHAFLFAFTTCTTVGYGNISPHDQLGQVILMFYSIIGLPLNGFVFVYVADYFTKVCTKIYKLYRGRVYSETESDDKSKKFGMMATIALYLVPGIIILIFLPAFIIAYFEDWPYFLSAYYAYQTLTTIGFGDYVPTYQDGQAREFGTSFVIYEIFLILWQFIGLAYFLMILAFIAKGLYSKRIEQLEHQISMNIKEAEHRIWTEISKDLDLLQRILNEANLMKYLPMYPRNAIEQEAFHSKRRSSSYPEISVSRNESLRISRERADSENGGQVSLSSSTKLSRRQSDGDLTRIDKEKTFEDSSSLIQNKNLLSDILTALGSIKPMSQDQIDSSNEWTWDRNNSQQIREYIEPVNFHDDLEMQTDTRKRSSISSKHRDRILSQDCRRFSAGSQDSNTQKYLENTSKGRGSRMSLSSHLTCDNMELLESTTVADLIRAIEGPESKTKASPEIPLFGEYKERLKTKIGTPVLTKHLRSDSLRPTHDYTTIFTSQNNMINSNSSNLNRQSALISGPLPINQSSMNSSKRMTKRIRLTNSSIPTVEEL